MKRHFIYSNICESSLGPVIYNFQIIFENDVVGAPQAVCSH